MSELRRSTPSFELPAEELELYLEWIGIKNQYAEYAVDFFRQCRDGSCSILDSTRSQEENPTPHDLSATMLDLAVATDEPELAIHFLDQIDDLDNLIDLYFNTQPHSKSNAAEKAIHDRLVDLPHLLSTDPLSLCKYLVREIDESGPAGQLDIPAATAAILKIASDKQVLRRKHSSIDGKLTEETPEGISYRLALALLKCGEYDSADQIVSTLPNFVIRSRQNGIGFYLNDMYKYEKWLAKTMRDELTRKEKAEVSRAAESDLNHWHADNSYSALCLALNNAGKSFYHDYYVSHGRGLGASLVRVTDKTTWTEYARSHPWKFLWDDLPPHFHGLYKAMFPEATAAYWASKNRGNERYRDSQEEAIERIRAIANSGNGNLADREFHEMLEGRNNWHYNLPTKLKAAVEMAKSFAETPVEQLDLEAEITAETEIVGYELNRMSLLPIGVVEESEHRQELDSIVEKLLIKIEDLNQEGKKEKYFEHLLAVISGARVINPKIKQAVESRLGATGYVRQNLFKTWAPSEVPNYFVGSVEQRKEDLEISPAAQEN